MSFDLHRFPRSLRRAVIALVRALREEHNFRLQVFGGVVVLIFAAWRGVRWPEFALLTAVLGFVPVLELVISSVERLVDIAEPRLHSYAALVKDLLAAAVLLAAIVAGAVAVIVLMPYLVRR